MISGSRKPWTTGYLPCWRQHDRRRGRAHRELTGDLVAGTWANGGYVETGTGMINAGFEAVANEVPMAGKTNEFIRLKISAD